MLDIKSVIPESGSSHLEVKYDRIKKLREEFNEIKGQFTAAVASLPTDTSLICKRLGIKPRGPLNNSTSARRLLVNTAAAQPERKNLESVLENKVDSENIRRRSNVSRTSQNKPLNPVTSKH
jgi:hypothetical protein